MAEKQKIRNIGIKADAPKEPCADPKCPFHGNVKLRGKSFRAKVIRTKMQMGAVVEWERRRFVPKYERYEKRRTRIKVHNPPCIKAKEGDLVTIHETRPLSKTIHFVIISKNESDKGKKD